ncbi:MAG: CsgG/HfaB family protein [Fibrobacterota bacterium]
MFYKTIILSGVFFAALLQAADIPSLAVNDLEARGITKDEALVLSDKLRSEIIQTGVFRLLERGKMDEILKEQGFQKSGACNESSCMIEMGQLLGVENLVAGSIGKVGESYSVSVRMFSVKTGEIQRDVSMTYKGKIDGLLEITIPAIAKKLSGLETNEKPKSHFWWWVAGGAVVVGGGAAVFVLTQGNDEKPAEATTHDLTVTW